MYEQQTGVLYLSYDGMTDPLGQSQVIPYLAELTKHGYHFHLVSFEKPDNYKKYNDQISELLQKHNITWHPLPYTKNPPVISTVIDLNRMKRKAEQIITENTIKIIHCRSYISGMAGLSLSKKTGIRFLFDMRGFWADERVDGGLWNLSNPIYNLIYRFFKNKEKQMIAGADAVISLTENAKNEINSWQIRPQTKAPIEVIPCCADLNIFNAEAVSESKKSALRKELAIAEHVPVISYLGTTGTWYLMDEMLIFFKLFLSKYPEAIFFFISRDNPEEIISSANKTGIPTSQLRFFAAQRNEVPTALALSTLSLFFIKPAYSKKASSPTKQGEIMGMGLPLICNKNIGDTDAVVQTYGSGIVIDLNKESMQLAVANYDALIKISPSKIRAGAVAFYSLEKGVKAYLKVYGDILKC